MNPLVRTGMVHAGSAIGGGIAVIAFMSSHKVDLYSIWDQLNVVVADITKLIAVATPIATGAYGIWKTTIGQRLVDLSKNPDIKGIVTTQAIANSPALVDAPKVQTTAEALPSAAKA